MSELETRWLITCERIATRWLWLGRFLWGMRTVAVDGWAAWWEERSPREPAIWGIPLSRRDLEFLDLRRWNREAIVALYSWPSWITAERPTPSETAAREANLVRRLRWASSNNALSSTTWGQSPRRSGSASGETARTPRPQAAGRRARPARPARTFAGAAPRTGPTSSAGSCTAAGRSAQAPTYELATRRASDGSRMPDLPPELEGEEIEDAAGMAIAQIIACPKCGEDVVAFASYHDERGAIVPEADAVTMQSSLECGCGHAWELMRELNA